MNNVIFYFLLLLTLTGCCLFAKGNTVSYQSNKTPVYVCEELGEGQWFTGSAGIMGTNIYTEIWAPNDEKGESAVLAVMTEMERINQLMSTYIDSSEISLVNKSAATEPVRVSDELFELLTLAVGLSEDTGGSFDITYASVGYLYDFRSKIRPDQQQIDALLEAINFKHVVLNPDAKTVYFSHPNVKIDLGGIAKGHAIDTSLMILTKLGVKHALVTAGGDTGLLGDRCGRPWKVGIRDPRDTDRQAVVLPLENIAMSTSGDYERYFEEGQTRYHHIISPNSGKSAYQVQSVTIVGKRSTFNDALSTAVFVMGVQKGIDLLNRTPGYEVLIVDNQRKLHVSKGFNALKADSEH